MIADSNVTPICLSASSLDENRNHSIVVLVSQVDSVLDSCSCDARSSYALCLGYTTWFFYSSWPCMLDYILIYWCIKFSNMIDMLLGTIAHVAYHEELLIKCLGHSMSDQTSISDEFRHSLRLYRKLAHM